MRMEMTGGCGWEVRCLNFCFRKWQGHNGGWLTLGEEMIPGDQEAEGVRDQYADAWLGSCKDAEKEVQVFMSEVTAG